MNYRHIYHAGNVCDVVKHVTLLALLAHLKQKTAPFAAIDTHAGCGLYDLDSEAARKTAEADDGVSALLRSPAAPEFMDYRAALGKANPGIYPGSPHLILHALRPGDRYIGCELHPEDYAELRNNLGRSPQAQLHQRDGYEALAALVPPQEKRGLALIDPPYEQPDEYARVVAAVAAAYRRWPAGIYAIWYPIKDRPALWQFHEAMASTGIGRQLLLEFIYRDETRADRLNGSGMIVINPPWQFDAAMRATYAKLHETLATEAKTTKISWLTPESNA
ncbi:MAG: 23S rRNA (adenine(2030)-N(6))-methyltransferase RlmJ [Alphaproteobacteria bacterium]